LSLALSLLAGGLVGCGPSDASMVPVGPGTVEVRIASAPGATLAFVPDVIEVPNGRDLTVTFENDSSVPHNLVFTGGLTAATRTIVAAGTTDRVVLAAPDPGTYPFVCTIHEGMAGTLVVADPP
jgi:plastocyanin